MKNKVCIIIGGVGLIGSAFSEACAKQGAKVVIADIKEKEGNDLIKKIRKTTKNNNVVFQKCDITKEKDVKNLIKFVVRRFKRIDALVNSSYPRNKNFGRKFEDVTYKDFCENVNMHLGGCFLAAKEVSGIMKKQKSGKIVNLGSIYGFSAPKFEIYKGTPMTAPAIEYAAIKGGIINLTKYLASYLGKYNIQVNSISPGGLFSKKWPKTFVKNYSERVKLGRMANPNDITGALVFLLSNDSNYLTGQNIIIDGGWSI